jgi:hypothetical protein
MRKFWNRDKEQNTTRRPKAAEIDFSSGTVLEQFEDYLAEHRKISDIVAFLAAQDERLLALSKDGGIPENLEDEVIEFTDYFLREFDDITYDARIRAFGEEPFVLRLADSLAWYRLESEESRAWEGMSDVHKKEASTLRDTLMAVRGDKALDFVTDQDTRTLDIPAVLYPDEIPKMRQLLLYFCAFVIRGRGTVAVEIIGKYKSQVFGIEVSPIGIWMPRSKEAMQASECTTPSGFVLEPEDDIEYIEIERERF